MKLPGEFGSDNEKDIRRDYFIYIKQKLKINLILILKGVSDE